MRFTLGLTGSIGMGKTTTSNMFKENGIPVWSADDAVHDIYLNDETVISKIGELVPTALEAASLNRKNMRIAIRNDQNLLHKVEGIVHPAVAHHRMNFLEANGNEQLVVLDIPLLFELGLDALCDGVLVVSVDKETQKKRVMERGTMSEYDLALILRKQMPDADKRDRADYVIETNSYEETNQQVIELIEKLTTN
ncbi:MAG: dephospho-CoA kinase [Pseudomonadota bacterium]